MIGITALLIWASLWIGCASEDPSASKRCFTDLKLELTSTVHNEGWNELGRGFLGIFTPSKLSDDHWQIISKIYNNKDYSLIKDFVFSMGGIVFLIVVSVILLLLFCAAPITLGVFSCTCKKKCKPKSNNIITFTGIVCNSVAIITIFLGILFCFLSISALVDGVKLIEDNVKPLPQRVTDMVNKVKNELKECANDKLFSSLGKTIKEIPTKISSKISEIPQIKAVMDIDFNKYDKKFERFGNESTRIAGLLDTAKTALEDLKKKIGPAGSVLTPAIDAVDGAKTAIGGIKDKLNNPPAGGTSIKQELAKVKEKRNMASKNEIESKVREKVGRASEQTRKVIDEFSNQTDIGFKKFDSMNEEISSVTQKIIEYAGKVKENTSYAMALNLVLLPCYLALASAVWSTYKVSKFAQKKKAKPREKIALLIPLAIGFGLSFLPLLTSTAFMAVAGVSNVACATVFKDDSFGFLPKLLEIVNVKPVQNIGGFEIDIPYVIQECKSHKPLLIALKLESKLSKDEITNRFDMKTRKAEMIKKMDGMTFGLPTDNDWQNIDGQLNLIKNDRATARDKIQVLVDTPALPPPPPGAPLLIEPDNKITSLKEVGDVVTNVNAFMTEIDQFVIECNNEINTAKQLKEDDIKNAIVKMIEGEAATPSLLQEILDTVNDNYTVFRKELLEHSTNCDFVFTLFDSVGKIVCDQSLGGLNGAYAAIGLAVLSFFSATFGTVMIWHSMRAGKGQKDEKEGSDESKKGKKKKGKEGEGEGGEGEVEEESPPGAGEKNMAGKVGEVAQPMQIKSEPTPPGGKGGAPAQVQAIPTDPAAPGEKTNPSLLPNDALPADPAAGAAQQQSSDPTAGTPLSPHPPIQMVKMEVDQDQKSVQDQKSGQNSITGAGGETQGGGAGATAPQ